jgi:hypothetical protein
VDLLQVLFKVLGFLLKIEVFTRDGVLQVLVCLSHFLKLKLKLDDLVDTVVQVSLQLVPYNIELFFLGIKLLLHNSLSDFVDVWLLLLQLVVQSGLKVLDFLVLVLRRLLKLLDIHQNFIVVLQYLLDVNWID